MPVVKTTSPVTVPSAPKLTPENRVPSASANVAAFVFADFKMLLPPGRRRPRRAPRSFAHELRARSSKTDYFDSSSVNDARPGPIYRQGRPGPGRPRVLP